MSEIDLSPEDLSDLIGVVYQSAFEERQWFTLMSRLTEIVPGVAGGVIPFDGMQIVPSGIATENAPETLVTEPAVLDFATTTGVNALKAMLGNDKNGYVARSEKFFAPEVWEEATFFKNCLEPYGFYHLVNLILGSQGQRGAFLSFAIPKGSDAGERLYKVLRLLSPHTIRAQQLSRALALAKRSGEVMGGFLDAIALPMLVVDASRTFMFGNAAGRRVIERGMPFQVDGRGHLSMVGDARETARFAARLSEVDVTLAAAGLRIVGLDGDLLLCITPFQPSMSDVGPVDRHLLSDTRLFAVFVGQPTQSEISTALLRDTFELTEREAEVCRALMSGKSAGEIAEGSGRALKTVRNQIQMIHEKLGVSSNAQLMEALSVFRTVGGMFDGQALAVGKV